LKNVHYSFVFRIVSYKTVYELIVRIGRGENSRTHSLPDIVVDNFAVSIYQTFFIRSSSDKFVHAFGCRLTVLRKLNLLQAHIPRVLGGLLCGIQFQRSGTVGQFADAFLNVRIIHHTYKNRLLTARQLMPNSFKTLVNSSLYFVALTLR